MTAENTSDYLAPPAGAIDRSAQETVSINIGAAVDGQAGGIRGSFYQETLERKYENASTTQERRTLVQNEMPRVLARIDQLEQQHDTALEEYAAGDRRAIDLYRTLVVVHQEASELEPVVVRLDEIATDEDMSAEDAQLSTATARVTALHGPVREAMKQSLEADSTHRVHVKSAGPNVVLATISDTNGESVYVREAYAPDASTTQPDQYNGDLSAALSRFQQVYPWADANSQQLAVTPTGKGATRAYQTEVTHEHGTLETYLDAGSGQIFYEVQRVSPGALPATTTNTTDATAGFRFSVTTTRVGWPLSIMVIDTTTGEPVAADITVNGDQLGSTDGGRLWTVQPRGTATINATHDGTTLTVTSSAP